MINIVNTIESRGQDKENHFHTSSVINTVYEDSWSSITDADPRFWLYINIADLLINTFTYINDYVPGQIRSLYIHFDWRRYISNQTISPVYC